MNWLDKAIASVSPRWAFRRSQFRALYEAATPSRLHKDRKDSSSANVQGERSAKALRESARYFDQNYDIAAGALDTLVANIVGEGLKPEPQVELTAARGEPGKPAEVINRLLLELWDEWIHSPEVTRQFDYEGVQRMACRTWLRDGEVFAQKIIGSVPKLDHNTIVPYSLELLEPDYCPNERTDYQQGLIQGARVNEWGMPTAWLFYKSHPGEYQSGGRALQTKEVAADRIIHLKHTKRLHQLRGISVFASVINRFDDIKEIDESERVAARVSAAMAAYIKKGVPDQYRAPTEAGKRLMEFAPGMVFDDLAVGEDIGTIASNRPNNALIPFRADQLRAAAGGIGAGYSSISKNYNGTYSAQRQELIEQYTHYRMQSRYFVFRWCHPVWDGFIDAAVASGRLGSLAGVNPASLYNVSHTLPPMPWIDPEAEAQANAILEDRGYTSRSRIIRERGDNPDQINREILRDAQERERLGIKLRQDAKDAANLPQPAAPQPDPASAVADAVGAVANAMQASAQAGAASLNSAHDALKAEAGKAVTNHFNVAAPTVEVEAVMPEQGAPIVNVGETVVNVSPAPVHVENTIALPEYETVEQKAVRDADGRIDKVLTTKRRK